ncbi:TIM barrel protein [Bacillus sp. 3255]|uniref:sugar phosphate isomerase/epimerase family protein n=1 Tax=Bacillus sp. 3255 TaxID=2817904 RepID=UPI002855D731|nr:TIM barrel protein [Bacillus sp. 3255]MDR6884845.1 sugar phosphate isomerase/epimerase [Bacillus sp. 3255]
MNILGFATNMYGWTERWQRDGRPEPHSWDDLLRECAEAGLDAVEIDATSEKLALARKYGLAVSASYLGLQIHEPFEKLDYETCIAPYAARLAAAGGKHLLLNADPWGSWTHPIPKKEEHFIRQGENLSEIARKVAPLGIRVSLHNHAADPYHAEGDLRSVVKYADPAVGLCVDTAWATVAGCDPIAWIRSFPERIHYFHLRNQAGRMPAEDLLEGSIAFDELIRAVKDISYEGWLALELWHPPGMEPLRSMIEDYRRSKLFLQELLAQA